MNNGGITGVAIGRRSQDNDTWLLLETSALQNGHNRIQSIGKHNNEWGKLALNPEGGNVGIGTVNPTAGLDINKGQTNDLALALRSNGPGWGSGMQFINTAQGGRTYGIYSSGGDGALKIADMAANADRLVIRNDGNVNVMGKLTVNSLQIGNFSIDPVANGNLLRIKHNNSNTPVTIARDGALYTSFPRDYNEGNVNDQWFREARGE